jgi:hypothetical protein
VIPIFCAFMLFYLLNGLTIRFIALRKASRGLEQMKPTEKTPRGITDALLMFGCLPEFYLTLRLGRDIQDEWMNSYQDVQITNTFKKVLRRRWTCLCRQTAEYD